MVDSTARVAAERAVWKPQQGGEVVPGSPDKTVLQAGSVARLAERPAALLRAAMQYGCVKFVVRPIRQAAA